MSTREERVAVFQDTMSWIDSDPELAGAVRGSIADSEVFFEDNYPQFDADRRGKMQISVTKERSFEAAMRLAGECPGAKIAVHNFANAFHPGGGVTKGSSAQEECLCRTSTLYPVISSAALAPYYRHHKKLNTSKSSDSLIYSEGILIVKTDEDLPRRMPKESWTKVDVITMAAPDLRDKSNLYAPVIGHGTFMNDKELFDHHVKRAVHMLTCAAAKGADILVLGAFGCGAFENNPIVVAEAYKSALSTFPAVFDRIVFAVYCNQLSRRNYDAFKRTLG